MTALRKTRIDPTQWDLTQRLREETMDLHHSLENHPQFSNLLSNSYTIPMFRKHLARMHGFYMTAEKHLAEFSDVKTLDLSKRLVKADRIKRDLQNLGLTREEIDELPQWERGRFGSLDEAWGHVYVIEGSTLGGRMIAKKLSQTLGIDVDTGLSFHQTYGDGSGFMWRQFKQATVLGEDEGWLDSDAVVASARTAFASMAEWFSGQGDA